MENLKDSIKKEGSISQNIDKNFYLEYYYLLLEQLEALPGHSENSGENMYIWE